MLLKMKPYLGIHFTVQRPLGLSPSSSVSNKGALGPKKQLTKTIELVENRVKNNQEHVCVVILTHQIVNKTFKIFYKSHAIGSSEKP